MIHQTVLALSTFESSSERIQAGLLTPGSAYSPRLPIPRRSRTCGTVAVVVFVPGYSGGSVSLRNFPINHSDTNRAGTDLHTSSFFCYVLLVATCFPCLDSFAKPPFRRQKAKKPPAPGKEAEGFTDVPTHSSPFPRRSENNIPVILQQQRKATSSGFRHQTYSLAFPSPVEQWPMRFR